MKRKARLILTVGLPRCGKSTWSRRQGVPVVNPDAIRLSLHGQSYLASAETMVWAIARYMVQSLFLAGHKTVILDATNMTHGRRDHWLSSEWTCFVKQFHTSKAVCERRAKATKQEYLLPVIERMSKDYQIPSAVWKRLEGNVND